MKHFKTYKDKGGDWRWQVKATNGQIVGAASEGFSSENEAIKNSERLSNYLYDDVNSDEHVRCCLIGCVAQMISSHRSLYFESADHCIQYMLNNKIKVSCSNGLEILKDRIGEWKAMDRIDLFEEHEYKKELKDDKDKN